MKTILKTIVILSIIPCYYSTVEGLNGSGANAKFNSPYSVIIDDNYDVYVADRGNYKIRKITQE